MCTLIFLPGEDGAYLLGMNRDENRDRPLATELKRGESGVYPIDPGSGGTWIASRRDGLTLALLNQTGRGAPLDRRSSRGTIIPRLLSEAGAVSAAIEAVGKLEVGRFDPFLLVAFGPTSEIRTARWSGSDLTLASHPRRATLFSSSSLDERGAYDFRKVRFDDFLAQTPNPGRPELLALLATQEAGSEALSILMERPDARTVSTSLIAWSPAHWDFTYLPIVDRDSPRET